MGTQRRNRHIHWLLSLIVITLAGLSIPPLRSQPVSAATNPGDYAAVVLGNPWDMSDVDDIAFEQTRDTGNVSGLTISNGLLTATATNTDPRVFLRWPVDPYTNQVPQDGNYRPIDAGTFRYFTVRVFVNGAKFAQVLWLTSFGGQFGQTGFKNLQNGWNTVTFDLVNDRQGGANWSGSIQGLMFDPQTTTGQFQIDYVRLSSSPPGSPNNIPPQIQITAPSFISGEDYATSVVGNPWDMSDSGDIVFQGNLASGSFNGGLFDGVNRAGSDDPHIHLRQTAPIDTSRFRYATYRMQLDGQRDTTLGSVARWVWWTTIPEQASVSLSWVVYEGFRTVSFDLNQLRREPANPQSWAQSAPVVFRFDPHEFTSQRAFHLDYVMLTSDDRANTSYDIRYIASDADGGTPPAQFFYFAEGTTNLQPITCQTLQNVAATPTKIYLPIISRLTPAPPAVPTGATCRWNTASVPAGRYFIYAVVDDGTDSGAFTTQTAVIISH
ncbi:MAG TPA: hypothetical protein VFS21_09730 [Roseiflexaceae bacterium]|nr:hypothetical protein [Roseiflexaceae bacterium]